MAQNRATIFATLTTITAGVPLVPSHTYTLVNAFVSNSVQYVTLRNPWGVDGAFPGVVPDSNPSDGLVTITFTALAQNTTWGLSANGANTTGVINSLIGAARWW